MSDFETCIWWRKGPALGHDPLQSEEIPVGDQIVILSLAWNSKYHPSEPGKLRWKARIVTATEDGFYDDNLNGTFDLSEWEDVHYWINLNQKNVLPPFPPTKGQP